MTGDTVYDEGLLEETVVCGVRGTGCDRAVSASDPGLAAVAGATESLRIAESRTITVIVGVSAAADVCALSEAAAYVLYMTAVSRTIAAII